MIIILGIPGVGKTSVLTGLEDCKLVNYGTLMFEIASREYGISSRDQIRKLSIAKQKVVQKKVAVQLSKMGKVLLDTHCMIRTPSGYLPGLPYSLLKGLTVDALVLVVEDVGESGGGDCRFLEREAETAVLSRTDEGFWWNGCFHSM
jgi:adenylate kinase